MFTGHHIFDTANDDAWDRELLRLEEEDQHQARRRHAAILDEDLRHSWEPLDSPAETNWSSMLLCMDLGVAVLAGVSLFLNLLFQGMFAF